MVEVLVVMVMVMVVLVFALSSVGRMSKQSEEDDATGRGNVGDRTECGRNTERWDE